MNNVRYWMQIETEKNKKLWELTAIPRREYPNSTKICANAVLTPKEKTTDTFWFEDLINGVIGS